MGVTVRVSHTFGCIMQVTEINSLFFYLDSFFSLFCISVQLEIFPFFFFFNKKPQVENALIFRHELIGWQNVERRANAYA